MPAAQLLRRPVTEPPAPSAPPQERPLEASPPPQPDSNAGRVVDTRTRPLRDLRLSVTDRCNFRCGYCMPKEVFGPDHQFLPRSELLSFEELFEVASVFVQ